MYQVLLIIVSIVIFTGCSFKHNHIHKDSSFKTTTEAYNCETEDAIYKLTYSYKSTMSKVQVDKEREEKLKPYGQCTKLKKVHEKYVCKKNGKTKSVEIKYYKELHSAEYMLRHRLYDIRQCKQVHIEKVHYLCNDENNQKYILQIRYWSNWSEEYRRLFIDLHIIHSKLKNCKHTNKKLLKRGVSF